MPLDLTPSHSGEDPRIKSPDDILSRLSPRKPQPSAAPATAKSAPEPAPPADAGSEAQRQLTELRARYDAEIGQWRDYERRIQEWRAQVVTIVQGLKRDAAARHELVEELNRCRAALKAREDELQRIRAAAAARQNLRAAM